MDPNNNSPESAPASEPTTNATAASIFADAVNPAVEGAVGASGGDQGGIVAGNEADLAKQAQEAAKVVEPTVVNDPVPAVVPTTPVTPPAAPVNVVPIVQPAAPVQPVQQAPVAPVQQTTPPPVVQDPAAVRKALNIYDLTEADYDAVFSTESKEESIKALNGILQNAVRQAVTMSNVLLQEQQQQLLSQVQPYMQFADNQKQTMMEGAFFQQHPDLVASKPVVDAVLKQFSAEGRKFNSPEEAFAAVAQNTKAYLSQLAQLGQTTTVAPVGPGQTHGGKPQMAVLPTGGQGGSAAGGGNSGKVNTAQRLFG